MAPAGVNDPHKLQAAWQPFRLSNSDSSLGTLYQCTRTTSLLHPLDFSTLARLASTHPDNVLFDEGRDEMRLDGVEDVVELERRHEAAVVLVVRAERLDCVLLVDILRTELSRINEE